MGCRRDLTSNPLLGEETSDRLAVKDFPWTPAVCLQRMEVIPIALMTSLLSQDQM